MFLSARPEHESLVNSGPHLLLLVVGVSVFVELSYLCLSIFVIILGTALTTCDIKK